MDIFKYISKFINDVLFNNLNYIMPYNKIHFTVMIVLLFSVLILLFVYRYLINSNAKRKKFIQTMYILLVCLMAYSIFYADIYVSNIRKNGFVNIVHLIYSILPLSIPYLSTIMLGIIIFSKKECKLINSFVAFITPVWAAILIIFYEKDAIIHDDILCYFVINGLLILLPTLLIILKAIKIDFRSMCQTFVLLTIILIISFLFSMIFEYILPHSLSSVVRQNIGTIFRYNYNYTISPITKYRYLVNEGIRTEEFYSSNLFMRGVYSIIPVSLLYNFVIEVVYFLLIILFYLLSFGKKSLIDNYKTLIRKPCKYFFSNKVLE